MNRLNSESICGYFCTREIFYNLIAGVQSNIHQTKNVNELIGNKHGINCLKNRATLVWI